MTNRKSILLFLVFGCFNSIFAQLPRLKTYTFQEEGLVSNFVRTIFQDSKGFIWIGTSEGLSQYNGYRFVNYSTANGLSYGSVTNITEIDGKIYVALFDGSVDCIENGRISKLSKFSNCFNRFVKLPDQTTVALSNGSGIYSYLDKKFSQPKQETFGWHMNYLIPVNDSLFVGASLNSIFVVSRDWIPRIDTLIQGGRIQINCFYKDSRERIWVCTNNGLFHLTLDIPKKKIQLSPPPPGFCPASFGNDTRFNAISEDPSGFYWIATTNELAKVNTNGTFKIYRQKDGLPSTYVIDIFHDREKNTWMGTAEGLVKINAQDKIDVIQIPEERKAKGLPIIYSILPLKNDDLMFTTNGHHIYHPRSESFSNLVFPDTNGYNYIVPHTNPLLFYDAKNISYFDSGKNKFIVLKPNIPRSYTGLPYTQSNPCVDEKGNAFIGILGSITVVSPSQKIWINETIPDWIWAMTVDKKGFLWVATQANTTEEIGNHLYRVQYSFQKDSLVFLKKDYSQLVKHARMRSLFTDSKGNIWVGTQNKGVFRLTQHGIDDYDVITFDQSSGLISNYIRSFAETSAGDILLSSSLGIDKLVKEKNGFRIFNFSKAVGLYGIINFIVPADNNEWWCIADNKLVRFKDIELERTKALPVEIITIRLGTVKDSIEIRRVDTVVSLRYYQNYANFEFSAPGFINEKQILYSYRLLGTNDTAWSIPKNIHEVFYASLQPGKYVFEVRTIGWNGEPGATTHFKFSIRFPFWKTWWFILSLVAALVLLLSMLYRYRIRQLQRIQQVRNRIASDLHDDIGSTLTNISILTELSKRSRQEPEKAEVYMDRIREEIDASGQALDDIIWSVNSKNDTLQETAARMRRYAAEVFDNSHIKYELEMDPLIAEKKIMMEQRRDLFLIFKETLKNIQKHAAASVVSISLFIEKENITLIINDNGKGFDTTKHTHRNGIKNLEERVGRWKGGLIVESGNGHGTTINVRLPLSGITQNRG